MLFFSLSSERAELLKTEDDDDGGINAAVLHVAT